MAKKFALIGAAGYIAPRHMKAIKDVGGELVAALDPHDSVGVLDGFFPNCEFFTEFERFERFMDPYHNGGKCPADYLVVCSPNYLHDAHIRFGLRIGIHVICEKPLTINIHNLTPLLDLEKKSVGNIYPILQCRLHPKVQELKQYGRRYMDESGRPLQIAITYNTPRGPWYLQSWKGEDKQSGGVLVNIGIHMLDLMCWAFGEYARQYVVESSPLNIAGHIDFKEARVSYDLNLRSKFDIQYEKKIDINQGEFVIDLTEGFQDLHTQMYENILKGEGFSAESAAPAIALASDIREGLNHGM
ncbi:Gfo/Idh/MocA family oxidoreductase [Neptuniibacter sp.]|uniref:Gfo/Idh/MocA family protein n=1 Tax=Neptuniibacter sp. TaxID=1962643 RepID=UPI00260B4418|nr:Gfo/Idh/MocA family oxidoreductase [Neptuniibacter sp.]MCP4596220.1 Gfo/Idh/MocA family oxidoreductase [Neptuniibacter sp.]